jgi:membrane protein YqaA with SNARE-associated domain
MPDKGQFRELIEEAGQLEEEMVPPAPALPSPYPEINIRKILIFLALFYSSAAVVRIFFLHGPGFLSTLKSFSVPGSQPPAAGSVLFGFFLYMCAACQFFPIPTLPSIAFAAKVFHPVLIAFVGALGTCVANLNDYAIVGWLFRHHKVRKIRDINTYKKLLDFFDRYAFLTLSAASFLPIPIDVIRLLAISRAYSYWKYLLAAFTGRFPRYLIIAYVGKELPAKYILIIFAVSALPAVIKFISDIIKKRKKA